jgi:hypothetical protein
MSTTTNAADACSAAVHAQVQLSWRWRWRVAAMAVVGRWRKLGSRRPGAAFRLSGACQSGWQPIILQSLVPPGPACPLHLSADHRSSWCGVQEPSRPQLMSTRCPRDRTFSPHQRHKERNYSSIISSSFEQKRFYSTEFKPNVTALYSRFIENIDQKANT